MSGTTDAASHKTRSKWLWLTVLLITAAAGTGAVMLPRSSDAQKPSVAPSPAAAALGIGCRGWIEPEDGVIKIAAPFVLNNTPIIGSLQIKEGDSVTAGQVLAILDGKASLEKALHESEAEIEVQRMKLAQIKAGPKAGEVEAQKKAIGRWESEYEIAQSDFQRFEALREAGIGTAADLDQKRLAVERAKRSLDEQRERLKALEEVRPVDVNLVSAQLDASRANADVVREQIDHLTVRSPAAGIVLKIHAHAGEQVGSNGILELAKTNRMFVTAEVYETDIGRVHVGQKATVSGDLIPAGGIDGVVTHISNQIGRSDLLPTDAVSFSDTRVVKVYILLQNAGNLAGLIHGNVNVLIHP